MKITEKIDIRFPRTLAEALRLQAKEETRGKLLAGKSLSPALIEEAEKLAQASVRPIADIRSSAEYRRWASGRLVRDALENL